jgi:hypothetical protein
MKQNEFLQQENLFYFIFTFYFLLLKMFYVLFPDLSISDKLGDKGE